MWFINESSDADRQGQNSFGSVVLLMLAVRLVALILCLLVVVLMLAVVVLSLLLIDSLMIAFIYSAVLRSRADSLRF